MVFKGDWMRVSAKLLAALTVTLTCHEPATADVRVLITDENGEPLRRVWVQHWWSDYMTGLDGRVTIHTDDQAIDIRVYAHNPVVRMDDGQAFTFAVSQQVRVSNGDTIAIPAQGEFWRIAERFRDAYDDGLREFTPWNNRVFPFANVREPDPTGIVSNYGIIRASWPDQSFASPNAAWVEGAAIYSKGLTAGIGFPLIHLKQGQESDSSTIRHELGHALHFAHLPNQVRMGLEGSYGLFLAGNLGDPAHRFDRRTTPTVAWIEAFGIFADEYGAVQTQGDRHALYLRTVGTGLDRFRLLNGDDEGPVPAAVQEPMFGDDIEGAVFLALFYEYVKHPDIGLDFVVTSYVDSACMDFSCYSTYIKDKFGESSSKYLALIDAAGCYGIKVGDGPVIAGGSESGDEFGSVVVVGDWNGDRFKDVAIGSPYEDIGSDVDCGIVNVLYGSPDGLVRACNCAISQNSAGVPGSCEDGDRFGASLASGDFNADGVEDLAIGAPGESIGDIGGAGSVIVIDGSFTGLQPTMQSTLWWADKEGVEGASQATAGFGSVLAAGNFNGDGADDLAIGSPGYNIIPPPTVTPSRPPRMISLPPRTGVGSVNIVFGERGGLNVENDQHLLAPINVEDFGHFGFAMASGDMNGDRRDELAIGIPGDDIDQLANAGTVIVLLGANPLPFVTSQAFSPDLGGGKGGVPFAAFGQSLAFGDFNGDGLADLAVGAPGDDVGGIDHAGSVSVFYSRNNPAFPERRQLWTYGGVADMRPGEVSDSFGLALASGDFDGNGFDDLAIGAPNRDVGNDLNAGNVTVLYARPPRAGLIRFNILPAGLSAFNCERWFQGSTTWNGGARAPDEHFGASLATGDFRNAGFDGIVIGVSRDTVDADAAAGAIHEIGGGSYGLAGPSARLWNQDS